MKKIILFLAFFSALKMQAQQSSYLSEIIIKWDNAKKYTLATAELMPDSTYTFAPTKEEMTFANQMAHLCENMIWLSSTYIGKLKPPFEKIAFKDVSKKTLIEKIGISFDFADSTLKSIRPENLEERVNFFAGKMTKRQIINLMNDHLTHHNAQCLVYLRLKGIKPPPYVGW